MEKKEAQFNEVLAASNIDPTMLGNITRKLDDVMEQKNKMVKGLQVRPAPPTPTRWWLRRGPSIGHSRAVRAGARD